MISLFKKDLWSEKLSNPYGKVLLSVVSALAGVLAFPPFEFNGLAWVALVPLIFAVRDVSRSKAFLLGLVSGAVFFGGVLCWLVHVSVPGMIVLVLVLSLFYAIFAVLVNMIIRYDMDLMILPFAWVALEFLRSNLLTGFPWGILAHTQYRNINLIQIADLTGAYGVSFIIVAFNCGFFAVMSRIKRRITYLMVPLIFILVATTYGIYRTENTPLSGEVRLSVVQGNIPQNFKWDSARAEKIISEYSSLTLAAAETLPDMIIWPETSYPYLLDHKTLKVSALAELSGETGIPLMSGVVFDEKGIMYNSAVMFDGNGGVIDIYRKTHLVPFGEYIPFEKFIYGIRDMVDKPIGAFGRGKSYTLFPLSVTRDQLLSDGSRSRTTSFIKCGVLICFEDIFPYISRSFAVEGADILINITNDAWFARSAASKQHMIASVFRAVENRLPVVRSANTGVSCFIDPNGNIISFLEEGGSSFIRGFDTSDIPITHVKTYYSYSGDTFSYFCGLMLLLLLITERFLLVKGKTS